MFLFATIWSCFFLVAFIGSNTEKKKRSMNTVKQALDSALETALQLALTVPLTDVTAFPKLCKAYFVFFEILFRNHIAVVLALDTPVFMSVMHALHEGLQVR